MAKRSIPFEEAREFIRSQCIGSRKQYAEWYKANRPKKIPKYPNRAYADEWKGWNDFLGNNNKFDNERRNYRPFAEAMAWAHKLGLKGVEEWLEYVKENRETFPEDIPTRPDVVYDDWLSWNHWLGNRPQEKVEAAQQVEEESAVFYCIQQKEYADQSNIFTFGIEKGGISALKENWELSNRTFRVIKVFRYDPNMMEQVQNVIDSQSSAYYGASKVRICPNVNQLLFDISNYLMFAQIR